MTTATTTQIITNARQIIATNAKRLEIFVKRYLLDTGIAAQLMDKYSRETARYGVTVPNKDLLTAAVQDLINVHSHEYDLFRVLDGAASLEFLVRYARLLDSRILPPAVIPSDLVVDAALDLFHEAQQRGGSTKDLFDEHDLAAPTSTS